MTEVTRVLNAIDQGDAQTADELLPLLCDWQHPLRERASSEMVWINIPSEFILPVVLARR